MVRAMPPDEGDDRVLRAKYLDWCSARVAERFLELTPDEIYELAHGVTREGESEGAGHAEGVVSPDGSEGTTRPAVLRTAFEPESFRELVEMVTQALALELGLPNYETWRGRYEERPDEYEDDLLGFWRESL